MKILTCLWSLMLFVTVSRSQSLQCVTVYERNLLSGMVTGSPCGKDSVMIYYWKDLVCYQLPYLFSATVVEISKSTGVEYKMEQLETRYQYFIIHKNEKYGFLFDMPSPYFEKWKLADSVISSNCILSNANEVYELFQQSIITSAETTRLPGNGILKKYAAYLCNDSTAKISFSLEFADSIANVNFSLSPRMDSAAGNKLIKSQVTIKSERLKECGLSGCDLSLGEIEILNKEIRQVYPSDTALVIGLFKRFEYMRSIKPDQ